MTQRKSILLIENDRRFLMTRKEVLELSGYQIYAASSVVEAKNLVNSTTIHLIVTDLRILDDNDDKDFSGLRLVQEIDPVIPKIVVTSFPSQEAMRELLGLRGLGSPAPINFIAKQEGIDTLIAAIDKAFQGNIHINFQLQIDLSDDLTIDKIVRSIPETNDTGKDISLKNLLNEELHDLLRKMFFIDSRIVISPFAYSPRLLKVIRIRPEGSLIAVIVKIGGRNQIRREWESYNAAQFLKALDFSIEAFSETLRLGALMYAAEDFPVEDSSHVLWHTAQIEWLHAALAVRGNDIDLFEQSVAGIIKLLDDRLGSKLQSVPRKVGDFWVSSVDTSTIFPEVQLPDALPLMFSKDATIAPEQLDKIRYILDHIVHPPMRVALLFLFGDKQSVDQAQQLLQERLRRPFSYDIVVVANNEIRTLVLAEDPPRALRQLILSHVDLLSVSPFVTTAPVPDLMFFGRESELRQIADHADSASFAIIGGRRIGKTSLLGRLHRIRLPAAGFRTLYHDCATTPSRQAFLNAAIRNWRPEPPQHIPTTLGDLLRSPPDNKLLILLLDEADKLVPGDRADGWQLFNMLRGLANAGHVQVVLSGERTLREALQDPISPLFNFANEILIGQLDFRAVEELVTRPMRHLEIELVDEAAIVHRIYDFTSGHPSIVQRLCRRLIERLNTQGTRRIASGDVNEVIEDPQFQEFDFLQTYWDAASPLEKIITLVLAQSAQTYRLKEVRQLLSEQTRIRPNAIVTKDALDRLVDLRSIFKRSQEGYTFAVEAFPLVLANTTTVEDLLEVLVEQYEQMEQQG